MLLCGEDVMVEGRFALGEVRVCLHCRWCGVGCFQVTYGSWASAVFPYLLRRRREPLAAARRPGPGPLPAQRKTEILGASNRSRA